MIAQALQQMSRHSQSFFLMSEDQAYVHFRLQKWTFLEAFFFLPGPTVEQQVNLAHLLRSIFQYNPSSTELAQTNKQSKLQSME